MNCISCNEEYVHTPVLEGPERQPWSTAELLSQPLPMLPELDAGIISHAQFPLHKWFYANPNWYYHAPSSEHQLRTGPRFYELVDPDLRDLCREVHHAGLLTTPSCQGHFYPKDRFQKIWDELVRESVLIRATGLIVRDSESNKAYRYKDKDYQLPWPDFETFYEEASEHQHAGYVGIAVPEERHAVIERLKTDAFQTVTAMINYDERLSEALKQPTFSIMVDPESPDERDAAWRDITAYVHDVLSDQRLRA